MQSVSQLFDQACQHYQAGNFYQAELLYRQILQIEPRHVQSLHLLGLIAYQAGRSDLAVDLIRQALALQPEFPAAHNNLGNILKAQRKYDEATRHFQQALRQSPNYAEAYNNLAVNLKEQGRLDEAIINYQQALRLRPDYAEAYSNLGNALTAGGRFDEAIVNYQQALRLKPAYAEAYSNMGNALQGQGKFEAAITSYRQALRLKPAYVEALTNMGNALRANGQVEEAIASYKESLRLKPDYAAAYSNMGNALRDQGKFDEAVRCHQEALRLKPDFGEGYDNLGLVLQEQGRIEEAISRHRQALQLRPEYAEAHCNLGNALRSQGQLDEAIACYDQALRLDPNHAEAHFNRSTLTLLFGNFTEGWADYDWRWRSKPFVKKSLADPSMFPLEWDGSPLQGRTLLLHAEQGLGDTIQFVRYAPLLKAKGAGRVLLACPPQLLRLMGRCPGIDHVVSAKPFPPYDVGAFLLGLPRLMGMTSSADIPANVPYLDCDPDLVAHWDARLAALDAPRRGLRVGIAWQGSQSHGGDRWRSVRLEQFAPLADLAGVSLISLQKGHGSEQLVKMPGIAHPIGPDLADLADTAAVMRSLDLVISVDTAIVHLAGALGVPVWVALPAIPDWRWLLQREDSPWYPSMRLFRQASAGDWWEVFGRMAGELESSH